MVMADEGVFVVCVRCGHVATPDGGEHDCIMVLRKQIEELTRRIAEISDGYKEDGR
jgi:hypothetical protein